MDTECAAAGVGVHQAVGSGLKHSRPALRQQRAQRAASQQPASKTTY